uniref:Ig-like domain-containing protein n=1 Tax=Sinocyclocheilus anshuiensis TaxID=1608454 RepID=A0A671S267_9TELE
VIRAVCDLLNKMFQTFCSNVCSTGAFGVEIDERQTISAMEGDSVTLHMDVTELQRDNVLLWTFGPQDTHIAKINRVHNETFHNGADGRFRDRLKLDSQTGSLTITNVSTELNGLYKVEIIIENKVSSKVFIVKVYAHLPIPVITGYCPQNPPSSVSRCELLCSVVNVSHVTLSWYKGNSLLSSISASDLSNSVSLHLEVEYQDKNSYSCVALIPFCTLYSLLNGVYSVCSAGVFGADADDLKTVMEGESVTLNPDLTHIQTFDLIEWRFGDSVIAQTDGNDISYPSHTEIFRGRLQLDQSGSLTIKNIRTKHSGLYKLHIDHSTGTLNQKFSVTTGSLTTTNTRTTDAGLYTVKISSNKQTLYKRFTVTVSGE